jgi:hypothetical protein
MVDDSFELKMNGYNSSMEGSWEECGKFKFKTLTS